MCHDTAGVIESLSAHHLRTLAKLHSAFIEQRLQGLLACGHRQLA